MSDVFVKRGHAPGATAAEAAGLRWLASAGAVAVPEVRSQDDETLVIDRVPNGQPTTDAAERFGRGLARLHAAGAPAFGSPPPDGPADAWIGLAPMSNVPAEDWASWYASDRVLPYVRRAVDAGTFDAAEAAVFERACTRIPASAEPPARLHGDLWTGNVLWDGREVWLIDPAAHGGHRETDLAMLHLFGCPHLDRIVAAYDEAAPLAGGWRDRIGLHQLFPLLVHTVLFGRSYAGQALAAARSC
ncbi:Fructosamine-3-kinase [Amycolatopsis pretoriensis]|uniref:Fructosamine-3-kinase n=1 Tax=Amycolatopsis pretoriensis TaxID=218821 RepID=A0A1H5Q870_9PSEU|nr:fructosamine kinase family protein [Amycolatopsis pretoriensis]SEF21631.1 Fructosamine-3-kinase [Amycolatopsis pretoriensis]